MFDREVLQKYADVLLWGLSTARKGPFKKGDVILIQYDPAALGLAEILYRKVLERGMYPIQRMVLTNTMERTFFELADASQLKYLPPGDKELYGSLNGRIFLRAGSLLQRSRPPLTRSGASMGGQLPGDRRPARWSGRSWQQTGILKRLPIGSRR